MSRKINYLTNPNPNVLVKGLSQLWLNIIWGHSLLSFVERVSSGLFIGGLSSECPLLEVSLYPVPLIQVSFTHTGCLATVCALSFGLLQFNRGNHKKSQLAMKLRVAAQGGTVLALVVGALWSSRKQDIKKAKK